MERIVIVAHPWFFPETRNGEECVSYSVSPNYFVQVEQIVAECTTTTLRVN